MANDTNHVKDVAVEARDEPRRSSETSVRGRLDDVIDIISELIWEVDRDFRFTYISSRIFDLLSVHGRDMEGRRLLDVGQFLDDAGEPIDLDLHSPFRDVRFQTKDNDGEDRIFLMTALPIHHSETGEFEGLRGSARDLTEQLSSERALRDAKEHAEFASRTKTEFIANISHELRTPLNTIIGFSELMERQVFGEIGNPQYIEYLGHILESGTHLLDLINDLLDVSAIEAEKMELHDDEIYPIDLIEGCVGLMQAKANESNVEIISHVRDNQPALFIDTRRVKQVLLNIIGNSLKFTPVKGRVEVSAWLIEGDRFDIRIGDTGIGIAEKDIPRVMAPFGQADFGLSREHEGTGLGLYLSRRIMELHDGKLELSSELGVGTTVRIGFPAYRVIALFDD